MKKIILLAAMLLPLSQMIPAQVGFVPSSQSGLQVYTMKTVSGTVTVNLPDKIYPGETVSGTVISEPSESRAEDREKPGKAIVAAQILSIFGNRFNTEGQALQFTVPSDPDREGAFMKLEDEEGMVGQTSFYVMEGKRPGPISGNPVFPEYLRSGEYQNIPGSFDGRHAGTTVMLGETEIPVVAESPGEIVTLIPGNLSGVRKLTITENGESFSRAINILDLKMAVDASTLRKGEKAAIHLDLEGLKGVERPVAVWIDNLTPMNISMEGGNHQIWTIVPEEAGQSGLSHKDITISAVSSGAFTVSAKIADDFMGDNGIPFKAGDEKKPREGEEIREDDGKCGAVWYSDWKSVGKDTSSVTVEKTTEKKRCRCETCSKKVMCTITKIPVYEVEIMERFKYTCDDKKGHTPPHHGSGVKDAPPWRRNTGKILYYRVETSAECGHSFKTSYTNR